MSYPDQPQPAELAPAAPKPRTPNSELSTPEKPWVAEPCASQPVCDPPVSQTSPTDVCATQPACDASATPDSLAQRARSARKRRYTVSDKVRAAARTNLAKAMAVDPQIRLRNTPRRAAARRRNIERAWQKQRDPTQIPGCNLHHGACSKNFRRTAPLAGEHPEDFERLQERLRQLFTPVTPDEAVALDKVADRLWRVRRVLGSRVHQERLMFYEALFAAAAEPHGVDLGRIVKLGELIADALDLREEALPAFAVELRRRQGSLAQAMGEWHEAMDREWKEEETPRLRPSLPRLPRLPQLEDGLEGIDDWDWDDEDRKYGVRHPSLSREPHILPHPGARSTKPARLPALSWGDWLARRFAENGWKLPGGTEDDRRMHDWLVKAAVLGGDHVHEAISAGLEQAIEKLAEAAWDRLEELRQVEEGARTNYERNLEDVERESAEKAAEEEKEEGRETESGEIEEFRRFKQNIAQSRGLWMALFYWEAGMLDGKVLLEDLGERNFEVQMALMDVLREVALYTASTNREQPEAGEPHLPGNSE